MTPPIQDLFRDFQPSGHVVRYHPLIHSIH